MSGSNDDSATATTLCQQSRVECGNNCSMVTAGGGGAVVVVVYLQTNGANSACSLRLHA